MQTNDIEIKEFSPPQRKIAQENQTPYYIGYAFLIASALLYLFCEITGLRRSDDNLTAFVAHYGMALGYLITLIWNKRFGFRKSWYQENIHLTIILLNLFLVSAYALNRNLDVFQDSVVWLCIVLITTTVAALSLRFYQYLPPVVQGILQAIIGLAIVLYVYMVFYVAPFYAVGTVGIILLGVGFHIFLPLTMVIGLVVLSYHTYRQTDRSFYWTIIGAGLSIAYTAFFAVEWKRRVDRIEKTVHNYVLESNPQLPIWIKIGETIEQDWISKRILKSDLNYVIYNPNTWHFLPSNLSWDEIQQHDPLVFIGSIFAKTSMIQSDRVKILHSISEDRHKSEERLWQGDNLVTAHVIDDIDIYPNLRFAYAEHYLDIKNTGANGSWWGNTQEALYTFQLPEGSVVTSLSLWIEGKEQKGILTSKGKATEAYNTIVGKEQRDPSVVHWREGNTVTVRVFPCTVGEERKVKIGITTPLEVLDGKLVYRNISFKGPSAAEAKQTLRVRFPESQATSIILPSSFEAAGKGFFVAEQDYDEKFELTFPLGTIPDNHFSFEGFTYKIAENNEVLVSKQFNHIYLDINEAWTTNELDQVEEMLSTKNVMVNIDEAFVKMTDDNWAKLLPRLRNRNFTLFPFHEIKNLENTLVITKGNPLSVQLGDLKETTFAASMHDFFGQDSKVDVFNLQGGTSTYINSLREFRVLNYATGDLTLLSKYIDSKQFPVSKESAAKIVLHDSGIVITKSLSNAETSPDNAPDHVARLFAYNNIMRQTGHHYFQKDHDNSELVDEAAKAYVVSPVSSLIVLETQADYARFGIKDIENSLHNATKQSTGAVPEPHEWIMIILCAIVVAYFKFKL
jgi:XrtN system VIT domain protein